MPVFLPESGNTHLNFSFLLNKRSLSENRDLGWFVPNPGSTRETSLCKGLLHWYQDLDRSVNPQPFFRFLSFWHLILSSINS